MSGKTLTVFGATGNQGASVITQVLAHPTLSKTYTTIQAVTRDPASSKAQSLSAKGVKPIKADMNDASSLSKALEGTDTVFAVTNFWESASRTVEVAQGKAIADAAVAAGVSQVVWSDLPDVNKLTDGVLSHVSHFDGKAEIGEYFESVKGDKMVVSHFMPGFYMSNMKTQVRRGPDGVLALALPWDAQKTRVPMFDAADDTGKFVAGILAADPKEVDGKFVHAVSQWMTPTEVVAEIETAAGEKVVFKQLPESVFEGFLPPAIAKEMTQNMVLIRDYSYYGAGSEAKQANSDKYLDGIKTTSWSEFVQKAGPWKY